MQIVVFWYWNGTGRLGYTVTEPKVRENGSSFMQGQRCL